MPIDYTRNAAVADLANHLEKELRKNQALTALLDDTRREHFVSARTLSGWVKLLHLPDGCLTRLVERFSTRERWEAAKVPDVASVLREQDVEADAADLLVKQVRKGLRTNSAA